jgi:hypothetical protein
MNQKFIARAYHITLFTLAWFSGQTLQAQQKTAEIVSLCQLTSRPDQYFGKAVTIHSRVRSYRHGTSISDGACPKTTLLLVTNQSAGQINSVSHFYQFLAQHRQSSKPIFATITGRLVKGSTSGFVLRRDYDFELDSVSDFSEGNELSDP